MDLARHGAMTLMTSALAALLIAIFLVWLAFLTWTIWNLWFRKDESQDSRVYTAGVQMFGIGSWVATLLALLYMRATECLPVVVCLLPAFLWMGYLWGRAMMAIGGFKKVTWSLSNTRWRGP